MNISITGEVKVVFGYTLHQIKAAISFADVTMGDVGGWIQSESNLDHEGNAWVYGDAHYITVGPIGSRNGTTTFFRSKRLKIMVACGCFRGDIDSFATKVKETHGNNVHAKHYLAAIELAKSCIDLTPEK